jgi:hypothetical protein
MHSCKFLGYSFKDWINEANHYTSWRTHPAGYVGSYGNPTANYPVNPYNAGYNMNQVCLLFYFWRSHVHILFCIVISSCFSKHIFVPGKRCWFWFPVWSCSNTQFLGRLRHAKSSWTEMNAAIIFFPGPLSEIQNICFWHNLCNVDVLSVRYEWYICWP